MGYHDDRVLKVDEELLQPGDGVQIQVVGRLVQKQDVRVAEQGLGQKDLYLLRCRSESFIMLIVKLGVDAKAVQTG